MDLFCPHCTRRVTVADDKAGQVLSCPLCTKQFMAPALAPATPPPPKPVPPPPSIPASGSSYGVGPALAPPPSTYEPASKPAPSEPSKPPAPPAPPPPPPPPGEYTRTLTLMLRSSWLAFVPTFCLVLIVILSFFTWHQSHLNPLQPTTLLPLSLWGLAFSEHWQGLFLAYTLLLILGFFLCLAALLLETNLFYAPQLAPLILWKDLITGVFLLIPLALLCFDYVDSHFLGPVNPIAVAMKVAFRLHWLAVLASFLMFWLHWRKTKNLPLPKWEMRW